MANLFVAIRNIFRTSGSPAVELGVQYNQPLAANTSAARVSMDSALQVSAVWAAIRLISETIASLPFEIFEKTVAGPIPAEGLRIRELLTQTPNTYQTPVEFWELVVLNLVSSGNAYIIKLRANEGGPIVGFRVVSSQQMETELLQDGVTVIHTYTSGVTKRVFAQESVWHIKLFGNGLVGMSPLSYATPSISIAQAADGRVSNVYSNGAKPAGVLMVDRVLTPEQRQTIRDNFKNLANGNDDRLFVLEGDMKYEQVSMSPTDIQLLDSRRFQIEDIGRFFGVPSVLLNQTTGTSTLGSNVYQIMDAFYKLNLRPYLEKIESSIHRWLMTPAERKRYEAKFDFEAILQPDENSRAQTGREQINSSQRTPNEIRARDGYPPLPGGDTLLTQGAMVPLQQAGQMGGAATMPNQTDDEPEIDDNADEDEPAVEDRD